MSVIVPTYRRPIDLRRCILALRDQVAAAEQVIVVCRESDDASLAVIDELSSLNVALERVAVEVPGVVAALNAGLGVARCDIVAFTDDDAAPKPDWVSRLRSAYEAHPEAVGVGGRDIVHGEVLQPGDMVVGKIQWFGRMIGNHHLGAGSPRTVDMLKGVNMSFRRSAIGNHRLDVRLRGGGAQVHNELAFGVAVTRGGGCLIYDPAILVDHYPAQRFDADQRRLFSSQAFADTGYNETLILLEYLPWYRGIAYLLWAFAIGTRMVPGLAQSMRSAHGVGLWRALLPTLRGRLAALRDHLLRPRPDKFSASGLGGPCS